LVYSYPSILPREAIELNFDPNSLYSPMKLLNWPFPALLAWGLSWLLYTLMQSLGVANSWALICATLLCVLLSALASNLWRRFLIVLGFPMSQLLLFSATFSMPPLAWLCLLVLIVLVYPLNAWSDAPLFPTPSKALLEMPEHVRLKPQARILDAGCGLGDGLKALRGAYPDADYFGLEMSWLLRLLCALRCPWAKIRQGNIWLADWHSYDVIYMFQRPESMPHAVEKAHRELKAGSWLVSLEFEARDLKPTAVVYGSDGRPVWMYCAPFTTKASGT
jgi:SAM-dependent methyltransferase